MTAFGALLECLDAVHRQRPDLGLSAIVTFLLVCENQGVSVKELAFLSRSNESAVSRSISALRAVRSGSLVGTQPDDDDRRRSKVYLTAEGCALKDEIAIVITRVGASSSGVSLG